MNIEKQILAELHSFNQPLGVISTVNDKGNPESASIYYVYDDALNFYFITRKESRKYRNIEKNKNVAFVITIEHPLNTIQLEGKASTVTEAHEESEHFTKLVALASNYLAMPPVSQIPAGEIVFMKIATSWVRFGNFEVMKEENKFIEVNL